MRSWRCSGRAAICAVASQLALLSLASASCPFRSDVAPAHSSPASFNDAAFNAVDFDAVEADIKAVLKSSKPFWPADFGNYGGLMIRLAWHCAGSYRSSDGRGGCEGGRQRFEPERSWPDNTNLDKARALLQPIKLKYGDGLSWGDLIILAGTTAIKSMGGPVLGFCAGRIDDADGSASITLGPSPEQEKVAPCKEQGNCMNPLAQTTMGLIYVNPEGHLGKPVPKGSVPDIRSSFGRMGMDDYETVALIGGGHAFGKAHGACTTGPGPSPIEDPANSWPGTCGKGPGKGKGKNTFTSGFEGAWTETPTKWSNAYFKNLLEYNWQVHIGPGGHNQWKPILKKGAKGPVAKIFMLTADVALLEDPIYLKAVKLFAANQSALDDAFAKVWYKLTTRDQGPVTRCLGKHVPPAQPFQFPLPAPSKVQADYSLVKKAITGVLYKTSAALKPDLVKGKPYYGALFATLAWNSASTFRATDYLGGVNGARIRFAPEKDWPHNAYLNDVLAVLKPVKDKFGVTLSYSDLIVLAGQTALEAAGAPKLKFCGARSDAKNGAASVTLKPRKYNDPIVAVQDTATVMGLTTRETVALAANLRSPAQQKRLGYSGSWSTDPSVLTNAYFKLLLSEDWQPHKSAAGKAEYKAAGKDLYLLPSDLVFKWDPAYLAIVEEYATSNRVFKAEFAAAWTKMMNADRYVGPAKKLCP